MALSLRNGIRALIKAVAPSAPASGERLLFPKSDGWYDLDSSGTATKLGAGGSASAVVQSGPPSSPALGEVWFDNDDVAPSAPFIGARLKTTSGQTTSGGFAASPVNWSSEDYDTDAFHDLSTNPSRLTIPSGMSGYYVITTTIGTSPAASGDRWIIRILLNGSFLPGGAFELAGNGTFNPAANITTEEYLNAGDYLQTAIYVGTAVTTDPALCAMTLRRTAS